MRRNRSNPTSQAQSLSDRRWEAKVAGKAPANNEAANPKKAARKSRRRKRVAHDWRQVQVVDDQPPHADPGNFKQRMAAALSGACHIRRWKRPTKRRSTSLLSSFVCHLLVLLALAFWLLQPAPDEPFSLQFTESNADNLLAGLDVEMSDASVDSTEEVDQQFDEVIQSIDVAESMEGPAEDAAAAASRAQPTQLADFGVAAGLSKLTMPGRGGLGDRSPSGRQSLVGMPGGPTRESELAVENALKWLLAHQQENGAWRFDFREAPQCDGRCRDHGNVGSTTAATGLALLAFYGAGYTHQQGPYQDRLQLAIDYLVSRARKSDYGSNFCEGTMYAQAITTLALCEAIAMTGDEQLVEPAQSAIDFIVHAQHAQGGWRYMPGDPGDLTSTGWQMMALKSGQLAGLEVPHATWSKAIEFVSSVQTGSGYFGYQRPDEANPACTAIGILMRMLGGWHREHSLFATGHSLFDKSGPSPRDIYFNYYATQVMFHYGDRDTWPRWNTAMQKLLTRTQDQRGHQAGSWHFRDKHGDQGGRLYTTCMAIMVLEVPYRYLPLYNSDRFRVD